MTLRGTLYIPKVIVFYAYWGAKVKGYLSAFKRSMEEFRDLGILVEYGLVDLVHEAGKKCNKARTYEYPILNTVIKQLVLKVVKG
jgi:hypothetical protein